MTLTAASPTNYFPERPVASEPFLYRASSEVHSARASTLRSSGVRELLSAVEIKLRNRGRQMSTQKASNAKVQIAKDGPYMVSGGLPMSKQTIGSNSAGESVKWIAGQAYALQASYALCRCGQSAKKPFCDGS